MWCLKMVTCTKRSCDLRVSLFDLVIFASENGPKVVEAAWAFWADILLVPVRRLHDAAVQAAGWPETKTPPKQKPLGNGPSLFE